MRWGGVLLFLLVASAGSGRAADDVRDVASLLEPIRRARDVPALGGAVVAGDRLVALGVTGVRERGKPEPAARGDRWHIGSCTKSMTATLCAMLVEEGKLAFDASPARVLATAEKPDPGWKDATLEHLLTNRAGAPASLDADGLWGRLWAHEGTPAEQRRLLADGVLARPPEQKPGAKFVYSNAGFALAGAMAETVAREPWETLVTKRLFRPLGMDSAGFGAPGAASKVDQPRGHRADGTPVPPGPGSDNPAAIGPAGTVHVSLADWAKYVALHLRREKHPAKLLGAKSFERLHAPAGENRYAMGWGVAERPWAGGRVLTHSGSNTMWFAVAWLAPEKDFAVLAVCNQGGPAAEKACDEVSAALIQAHLAAK